MKNANCNYAQKEKVCHYRQRQKNKDKTFAKIKIQSKISEKVQDDKKRLSCKEKEEVKMEERIGLEQTKKKWLQEDPIGNINMPAEPIEPSKKKRI